MPEYRRILLGWTGTSLDSMPLVCADDVEATEKAQRLVDGHDIELWSGE